MSKQRRLRRLLAQLSQAFHDGDKKENDASGEAILQGGCRTCEVIAENFLCSFTPQFKRQWGLRHNTIEGSPIHRYKTGTW